jgi:hypothetical protein
MIEINDLIILVWMWMRTERMIFEHFCEPWIDDSMEKKFWITSKFTGDFSQGQLKTHIPKRSDLLFSLLCCFQKLMWHQKHQTPRVSIFHEVGVFMSDENWTI